jgi:hypothetical protein
MNHQNLGNETISHHQSSDAFRLQGVDHLPLMAQEEVCPILKQYFDFLENALLEHGEKVDIQLLQEMLLEISLLLRSGKSQLREDGYLRLLDRITNIYARGLQVEDDRAFAGTAVNFADILETISQNFQNYDYTHSVSLLLHYMDKLFNTREESWLEVYEHLLHIPDTIHIMHQLRIYHIDDINTWIEEGVDNLFTLRDEQLDAIDIQEAAMHDLQLQIKTRTSQLRKESLDSRIIDINRARQLREIARLNKQCLQLVEDREGKRDLVALLDANIQEFSDRLAQMRRSTLMKLVWSNTHTPG